LDKGQSLLTYYKGNNFGWGAMVAKPKWEKENRLVNKGKIKEWQC